MPPLLKAAPVLALLLIAALVPVGCAVSPPARRPVVKKPLRPSEKIEPAKPSPQQPIMVKSDPAPARPQEAPAPPKPKPFVHTVRNRGETLIAIAAWYTGNARNWERLAQANPGLKPNQMPIGADILIPETILVKRQPMPDAAVAPPAPAAEKPRRAVPPAQTPLRSAQPPQVELYGPAARPAEPAQVELFGPIEQAPAPGRKPNSGLPVQLESLE